MPSPVETLGAFMRCAVYMLILTPANNLPALGQAKGSNTQSPPTFSFEVFSIRPHKPDSDTFGRGFSPNGYSATISVAFMIKRAYTPLPWYLWPTTVKLENSPPWIDDLYDVEARVAPGSETVWTKSIQNNDSVLLHLALQEALKDRCNFAFRVSTIEVPVLNLGVAKGGAKLTPAVPGAIKSASGRTYRLGEGFYIQNEDSRKFYGVSMQDLISLLMRPPNSLPVQDKTGIIGRYDFALPWYAPTDSDSRGNYINQMPLSAIGLELKAGKGPGYVIHIDRINRPDPN